MSAECNITDLLAKLQLAGQAQINAAAHAVDVFAEHVVGDAQEMCPVKTGTLQGSGIKGRSAKQVAGDFPIEARGEEITKVIGFNTNYAEAVHERLDVHHPQGEAKFLAKAIRNNAAKFGPFVAARVKEASGG